MSSIPLPLDSFNGIARLFPLPNMVLFPQVSIPLHIFEPRYRQMTADALAGDRLLALVLLKPGWEADYQGRPPIHDMACLAKITADERLADGRFYLAVRGLNRVRVLREVEDDNLYRSALVELARDITLGNDLLEEAYLARLEQAVPPWLSAGGITSANIRKMLDCRFAPSLLTDLLSCGLPLSVEFKQELLQELDVARRIEMFLRYLKGHEPIKPLSSIPVFPPDFSAN